MGYPDTFPGFCVDSPDTWNQYRRVDLTPKPFGPRDIDIKIECCGVCGSDVHTVTGGWGPFKVDGPLCVGHEVIGTAVKVGKEVTTVKEGDRVGVGAQVWACLECDVCKAGDENYCPKQIDTYNASYPDGSTPHGGWASHIRAHEYFVFNIPSALPSEEAAPLLCAGITTYAPLIRAGIGPGKKVGVVGIGGLGHLALQWSSVLGAETYALTHSAASKGDDAKKLGAVHVVDTNEEGWADKYKFAFDMLLVCADATHKFDLPAYLGTLKVGGEFHMVGLPDGELPAMSVFTLVSNAVKVTGSHLGNRQELEGMLRLAAEKGVRPVVERVKVGEEGCKEAVERVRGGKVRYRVTLVGYDEVFGK